MRVSLFQVSPSVGCKLTVGRGVITSHSKVPLVMALLNVQMIVTANLCSQYRRLLLKEYYEK